MAEAATSTEVVIPEDEHKLQTPWCFWYDLKKLHKAKAAEYAASLQKVSTCHSVEDFWRAYAHMTRPSKLETNCNLFLFRAGAGNKPMWESYPRGGCWILKIKKKVTMPRPVTVVPSRSTCRCCRSLRTARLRR